MEPKQYSCERCKSDFTRKQSLQYHLKKDTICKAIYSNITREDILKKIKDPLFLKKKTNLFTQTLEERVAILEANVPKGNHIHILSLKAIKPYKSILDAECNKSNFTGTCDFGKGIMACVKIFTLIFNTNLSTSCWVYNRTTNVLELKVARVVGVFEIVPMRQKASLREFLIKKIKNKKTSPQHWEDWFEEDENILDLKNGYYDNAIWDRITNHIMEADKLIYDYLL